MGKMLIINSLLLLHPFKFVILAEDEIEANSDNPKHLHSNSNRELTQTKQWISCRIIKKTRFLIVFWPKTTIFVAERKILTSKTTAI